MEPPVRQTKAARWPTIGGAPRNGGGPDHLTGAALGAERDAMRAKAPRNQPTAPPLASCGAGRFSRLTGGQPDVGRSNRRGSGWFRRMTRFSSKEDGKEPELRPVGGSKGYMM
jgi:hypothetical protein